MALQQSFEAARRSDRGSVQIVITTTTVQEVVMTPDQAASRLARLRALIAEQATRTADAQTRIASAVTDQVNKAKGLEVALSAALADQK